MRVEKASIIAFAALSLVGTTAQAARVPFQDHLSLQYPGAPSLIPEAPQSPYPMTYTDEVAQSLGVKDGHLDVISTQPVSGYMPAFSAGVDRGGAMLRFKWHPGE